MYLALNTITYNLLMEGYLSAMFAWISSSAALSRCAAARQDLPWYVLKEYLLLSTIRHVYRFFAPLFKRNKAP